jgi:hypothetical protein
MVSPATRKLLARRSIGTATSSDYVDWAVAELLAGTDTPNLRILAGLPKPPYWPDVERHFERTLMEMGLTLPEPEAYLREYVRDIARAILSGDTAPMAGCREIYQIWMDRGYPGNLGDWVYLDEGLDPGTYRQLSDSELEAAIRREAELLLTREEST